MTETLALRPYQEQMIRDVVDHWKNGITPVAGVAATGLGKTVFFSALARGWVEGLDPFRGKVLTLVHRDELAQQAAAKMRVMMPGRTIGIVKADVNEVDADCVVASVQTLRSAKRLAQLRDVGMVIIDECHHANAPTYQTILRHYGCYADVDRTPCVGVTATLERSDGKGLGETFDEVAFRFDIMFGIKNGYLADVVGLAPVDVGIDLSHVRKVAGDYSEGQLGEIMGEDLVCIAVADAYNEHGRESCHECTTPDDDPITWCDCRDDETCKGPCRQRAHRNTRHPLRRGVHFAPTVASAEAMADAYNRAGITCEVVTGATPLDVRAGMYHRFRTGETTILANCMVLTEGWDAPWAEICVMGRPTTSSSLYQQCVGRVLRPYPGKRLWNPETGEHNGGRPALVLDVVGAAKMHKLASLIDMSVWTPREGETLIEAEIRQTMQDADEAERVIRGPRYQKDGSLALIDLFGESESVWNQTRKGVWFVDAGAKTLFLWEQPDGNNGIASYVNKDYNGKPTMERKDLPFSLAMSICEQMAGEADLVGTFSRKTASWRLKNGPASDAQKGHPAIAGLPEAERDALTKTAASNLIGIYVASSRIDRYVR